MPARSHNHGRADGRRTLLRSHLLRGLFVQCNRSRGHLVTLLGPLRPREVDGLLLFTQPPLGALYRPPLLLHPVVGRDLVLAGQLLVHLLEQQQLVAQLMELQVCSVTLPDRHVPDLCFHVHRLRLGLQLTGHAPQLVVACGEATALLEL